GNGPARADRRPAPKRDPTIRAIGPFALRPTAPHVRECRAIHRTRRRANRSYSRRLIPRATTARAAAPAASGWLRATCAAARRPPGLAARTAAGGPCRGATNWDVPVPSQVVRRSLRPTARIVAVRIPAAPTDRSARDRGRFPGRDGL